MTTSNADIEIDLTPLGRSDALPLMLARPRDRNGAVISGKASSVKEALSAADADSPLSEWTEPVVEQDFSGGVGVSYNVAPGCYTRTKGYVVPAGYATDLVVPATHNSAGRIVAIVQFQGHTWFAQEGDGTANTARVFVSSNSTGAPADSLLLAAVNTRITDLCVFDYNGSGPLLYAAWNDAAGGGLSVWNGAAWTTTASALFGANRRDKMTKVVWTGQDGVSAGRLYAISANGKISYTKPNADPMLAPSWVEAVPIYTAGQLLSVGGSRHHVFNGATDGLWDLNALGESANLTSYTEQQLSPNNGLALQYLNNYIYMTTGQGLDRVYVGGADSQLQEFPGYCAPGWGTRAEQRYRGYANCLTVEQGNLVVAVTSVTNGATGIFWGKDRGGPLDSSRNPLDWWGPEIHADTVQFVTAMKAISPAAGGLRMFLASAPSGAPTPTLTWVSLPLAGAPLDDMIDGGPHRFTPGNGTGTWNPTSYIESLPSDAGDVNANKIIHENSIASRGLAASAADYDALTDPLIRFFSRSDPTPGQSTYLNSVDVTTGPSASHVPTFTTAGTRLQYAAYLISPGGNATPPSIGVLTAVRRTVWREAPAFRAKTLTVEYGEGVTDQYGTRIDEDRDANTTTAILELLTKAGRTTLRDRDDTRFTIKMRQVLDSEEQTYGDHKVVTSTIQVALLAGPL